jgi:hypothetical protein
MFRVTHRFHRNFIRQIPPNCQAEVEEVFKEGRNWFSWVGRSIGSSTGVTKSSERRIITSSSSRLGGKVEKT